MRVLGDYFVLFLKYKGNLCPNVLVIFSTPRAENTANVTLLRVIHHQPASHLKGDIALLIFATAILLATCIDVGGTG